MVYESAIREVRYKKSTIPNVLLCNIWPGKGRQPILNQELSIHISEN